MARFPDDETDDQGNVKPRIVLQEAEAGAAWLWHKRLAAGDNLRPLPPDRINEAVSAAEVLCCYDPPHAQA